MKKSSQIPKISIIFFRAKFMKFNPTFLKRPKKVTQKKRFILISQWTFFVLRSQQRKGWALQHLTKRNDVIFILKFFLIHWVNIVCCCLRWACLWFIHFYWIIRIQHFFSLLHSLLKLFLPVFFMYSIYLQTIKQLNISVVFLYNFWISKCRIFMYLILNSITI